MRQFEGPTAGRELFRYLVIPILHLVRFQYFHPHSGREPLHYEAVWGLARIRRLHGALHGNEKEDDIKRLVLELMFALN